MKLLVAGSLTKYNAQIARHNELLKTIAAKEVTIAYLHTVVKNCKDLAIYGKIPKG